jgi:hypothetical protein
MGKRKSFDEKNKYIHPTRKKIIDTVFGRTDNNKHSFGYDKENTNEKRSVGEVWTDSNGTTWEQKEGFKASVTHLDEIRQYLTRLKECSAEDCKTEKYNRVDRKLIAKTGMCTDCLLKFENQLKFDGTYPFYEDYKITLNKYAYITELRQKYDDAYGGVKQYFENILEDGTVEKWTYDIDIEKVKNDLLEDMKNADEAITLLKERRKALEDKLIELNHPELIRT